MAVAADHVIDQPDYVLIGSLITMGPEQFSSLYDGLAAQHGGRSLRMVNLLRKPSDDERLRYLYPLQEANKRGWLENLIEALILAEGVEAKTAPPDVQVELQSMLTSAGFVDYSLMPALMRAGPCICLIRILPSNTTGSGFLIGPQVVLTSWHVVRELLLPEDPPLARPNSAGRLEVLFDFHGNLTGTPVAVMDDWLLAASPAHQSELPDAALSADGTDFSQYLDFAMILLKEPVGVDRGFLSLPAGIVLDFPCELALLQHPGAAKLKLAHGQGKRYWPDGQRFRLLHEVNTTLGSSGGVVLDQLGQPVALHQSGRVLAGTKINGAIPTACIAARGIDVGVIKGLTLRHQITGPDGPVPVFGRTVFQEWVADALVGNATAITVQGETGSGRSFSTAILHSMLQQTSNFIASMSAMTLPSNAEHFAAELLKMLDAKESVLSALPTAESSNTTTAAWLRDELAPFLRSALEEAAGPRIMWLVIDDLSATFPRSDSFELLVDLLRALPTCRWLRVILLGNGIPTELRPDDEDVERLGTISRFEIENTIQRRMIALNGSADENTVRRLADDVVSRNIRAGAMPTLAELVRNYRQLVNDNELRRAS